MIGHVPTTVGPNAGEYQQHLAALGRSTSTIRCRTEWPERLVRDTGKPPDSLTTAELEGWLAAQSWSPQTRRIVITSLRQWFAWLVETGQRQDNPAAGLAVPPQPHYSAHPIPEPVLAAAMSRASGATWWLLRVAATTGLRRAELARLRGSDCRDGWLTVVGKGGRERRVPVPPDVAGYLADHPGVVFPAVDGSERTPVALGQVVRRAMDAGVRPALDPAPLRQQGLRGGPRHARGPRVVGPRIYQHDSNLRPGGRGRLADCGVGGLGISGIGGIMYDILSMGGRLLARTPDNAAAYRMAHRIADQRGVYVELHAPSGWVDYVYPSRVMA